MFQYVGGLMAIRQLASFFLKSPGSDQLNRLGAGGRWDAVDLLRGVSALVILIWHYQHFLYTKPLQLGSPAEEIDRTTQPFYDFLWPIYEHGFWAVQLFWMISGLVFSKVYVGANKTSWQQFAASRVARLYPLHFVTLVSIGVIQAISYRLTGGYQLLQINDGYHFFLNLFFISQWGFQEGPSFNEPIWSVSIEIAIYFLFFLIHRQLFSLGLVFPGILVIFSLVIGNRGTPLWYFAICAMYFFIGTVIYFLAAKLVNHIQILIWGSLASLAFFLYLTQTGVVALQPFINTEIFLLGPILTIVLCIDLKVGDLKFLARVRFIGESTYSLYLWHFPIQVAFLTIFTFFNFGRDFLRNGYVLVAWLCFMLLVGYVSYRKFERPWQARVLTWFENQKNT